MVELQKLMFHCRWLTSPEVPSFFGSYLRGKLGKHLWRASCALRRRTCGDCPLMEGCAYGFLFETKMDGSGKHDCAINVRPHPFALELQYMPPQSLREDCPFSFSILLFGHGRRYIPHLIYSAVKSGEEGIGRNTREGRGRFQVERINAFDQVIYSKERPDIKQPRDAQRLSLAQDHHGPEVDSAEGELLIRFKTPFRTKFRGRYTDTVPLHLLIRTALRRIEALEAWYGDGALGNIDHKGLIDAAEGVTTVEERLDWQEVPRFSYRQKRFMKLGGVVGHVRYRGQAIKRFLPILQYVAAAHLGKQTSFGLGWMEFEML